MKYFKLTYILEALPSYLFDLLERMFLKRFQQVPASTLAILSIIYDMLAPLTNAQKGRLGSMGSSFQGTFESYNKFGLPSLIIPVPCQANKLQEQVNYICAHGNIWCLPGWKVSFYITVIFIVNDI